MPASSVTELALRTAVNNTKLDLTSNTNQSDEIKSSALKRAQELLAGSNTGSSSERMNLEKVAIEVAIKGLELSFFAVKAQLTLVGDKRLAFDKERLAGLATFIVPTNVEETKLSIQERIIKRFMDLSQKSPSFATYLGVHQSTLQANNNAAFYSTFPFYRMSDALGQALGSARTVDKQRTTISLFFKSALPVAIADIEMIFQTENAFVEFWKATFKKENYLNDLRAPRFIMMALANLLWNLQHPVDPVTGYPLDLNSCIQRCLDVESFLNTILNSEEDPALQEINNDQNQLLSFVRKIEIHTKGLREAYTEEQLYQLNFSDLTNSAHRTLRIIDKSVFELIYSRKNPVTGKDEPDSKAADDLAYSVSYLNALLNSNPELIKAFTLIVPPKKEIPLLNNPPTTVIDVLILFAHSTTADKDRLYKKIAELKNDTAKEFSATLKSFYTKFIWPIKQVSKKELGASLLHKKEEEVATLTARRLLPLITLVIEDYRLFVDVKLINPLNAPEVPPATAQAKKTCGKEQAKALNLMAEGEQYYTWALSPFINVDASTEKELDELPKHQYRFTKITKLLDSISEIVENYKNYLQLKSFQDFLIKCLDKIKAEYAILEIHINRVKRYLATDQSITRNMDTILRPMTTNLTNSLESFKQATANFERIITAPDFTEQQKQLLSTALNSIKTQFADLFKENQDVISPADAVRASALPQFKLASVAQNAAKDAKVSTKTVTALRKLVDKCYDNLSSQSRNSEKGPLLVNLAGLINDAPNFTNASLYRAVTELTLISLSYRKTWFFQAGYAETRSAKIFIEALRDPEINKVLPLSTILFGKDVDLSKDTHAQIVGRLRVIREKNMWHESADQLLTLPSLG